MMRAGSYQGVGRWLGVLLLASISACVTPSPQEGPNATPGGVEKVGTKQDNQLTTAPKVALEPAGPSVDDQLLFVHRQSIAAAPFGVAEYQFLASLPQVIASGSVSEAAVAIGLVRTVLHPLTGHVPNFQETDLAGGAVVAPNAAADTGRKSPTLEQLCKERNLDLATALTENPLLGNVGIARQVGAALNQGSSSKEFTKRVNDALKRQALMWNEVAGAIPSPGAGAETAPDLAPLPPLPNTTNTVSASGTATSSPAAAAAVPGANIPTLLPAAASAPAAPVAPPPGGEAAGVLAPGENPLADAQTLADRGDYANAVKKAQAIPAASPQAAQAKEKIKEFSNLAVQDLRKKAASAFQTAMPVNDPKTKADYLRQAKGYLEEALSSYPEAAQLPTVRENLRIITQDLEKL